LITLHRAENTDNLARLQRILNMLVELDAPAIFPVHPRLANLLATHPRLRKLKSRLHAHPELRLVQPVPYLDMLALEKNARAIITDSGGVQKEAFFFQVPCITLRDESEWVETLESGFNTLVGADRKKFLNAVARLDKIRTKAKDKPEGFARFGGGKASVRIARILARSWR
jgi:UDP-N-acetylglucosamine 2-epimerase